jgi:hypothetical protein
MTSIYLFNVNFRRLMATMLLVASANVGAAELRYEVSGISDPLLANVLSHVKAFSIRLQSDVSQADYDDIRTKAI